MKCKFAFLLMMSIGIVDLFSLTHANAVQLLSNDQPPEFPPSIETESLWSDLFSRFHSANEKIKLQDFYKRNQCEVVSEDEPFHFYIAKTYWIQISTIAMERPKNWFKSLFEFSNLFEDLDLYVEEDMRHHSGTLESNLQYFIGPTDYKVRIPNLDFNPNSSFEIYLKADKQFRYILTTLKRGSTVTRKILKC